MVFPILGATPEYKAAFKALKVRQRLTIQMNFIAFFCSGYIYLSGVMEKAIIVLLLGILSLFVGALIGVNILGIAVAAYVAVNTNKWFYEKRGKRVKYTEPLNNRWLSQTKPPLSFFTTSSSA